MNSHAILAPSAGGIWSVCTPSARFAQQLPNEDTEYAAEGTLAHDLAALVLSLRSFTFEGDQALFNTFLAKIEYDVLKFYGDLKHDNPKAEFQAMYQHAESWAEVVLSHIIDDVPHEVLIERRFSLEPYVPLSSGTTDATIYTPRTLYVNDYKYGAGVRVGAKQNVQTMLYAVGALMDAPRRGYPDIETVVLTIHQPRAGGTSMWEISASNLFEWARDVIQPKAELAIHGIGDFVAGKHCQFCNASTVCKAYYDKFDTIAALVDKRTMTDEETAYVIRYGAMVKSWINKVEEAAVSRMQSKRKLEGFKLVAGRGRRAFKDEDEIVDILLGLNFDSDQIFKSELRALTELEKAFGPKRFKEYFGDQVITVEGKPTIALIDDDRPSIGASGADEYDDLT